MEIEGKIGVKRFQSLPKKILLTKRIPIRTEHEKYKKYEIKVNLWVMDVPFSSEKPKIGLTLSHGKGLKRQYLRIVFEDTDEILLFLSEIASFVCENDDALTQVLEEAISEWKRVWDKVLEARKAETLNSLEKVPYKANISE